MIIFPEKYIKKALALTIDTAFYNKAAGRFPIMGQRDGELIWYIDNYRAWAVPASGVYLTCKEPKEIHIVDRYSPGAYSHELKDTGLKKVIERRGKNGKPQKHEVAIWKAEDGREVGLNAGFLKLYSGMDIALTDGGKEETAVLVHDLNPDGEVFGVMMPVRLTKE